MLCLVIIPTFNEQDNIRQIVQRVTKSTPLAHILIVDDGSPDGTGEVADALAESSSSVFVLHRSTKSGLGGAYLAGFAWALDRHYQVIVEMDADGSHAPEQLPLLLNALGDTDLILGSRWVAGGKVTNWPKYREVLSRGGNRYAQFMLRLGLSDATGGYRAYRREVLETLDVNAVQSQGYCFQIDMAWRTVQAGFRVGEVPITFAERQRGESKMSGNIVLEALLRVTVWGFSRRWSRLRSAPIIDRALAKVS